MTNNTPALFVYYIQPLYSELHIFVKRHKIFAYLIRARSDFEVSYRCKFDQRSSFTINSAILCVFEIHHFYCNHFPASYEKPKGIKTAICNDLSFDYIPLRSSSGRLIRKAKHWQPLENRRKRDALNMTGKSDPIPNKLRKIAKGNGKPNVHCSQKHSFDLENISFKVLSF